MALILLNIPFLLLSLATLVALRLVSLAVNRLILHPLAKVPGPKLAALTHLYEFYHDAIRPGKFTFQIDDFHRKYGSVVRINPREVHIQDPMFFDQLYSTSIKLNKDWYYYRFVGTSDASFGTSSYSQHRQRRKALNRFFSLSAILDHEKQVRKCVLQLCARLEEHRQTNRPVVLGSVFRSLATDVISQYALPEGFNLLSERDLGKEYHNVNRKLSGVAAYNRHLPFIIPTLMVLPTWLVKLTATPGMVQMLNFQSHNQNQARQIVATGKRSDDSVLHGIFNSDLPDSDKTAERIFQEALTLVGAGSETTGSALEHIFYHVLANPAIKARLFADLSEAAQQGDLTSYETLKRIPYLDAVIKEGLRIGNEVSGRLPRYDPHNPITYKGYVFPPGTVISMSIRDMHLDPDYHPEPLIFDPERWLDPSMQKRSEQFFAPFGKGTRSCVGRELAMLEMMMVTAILLHHFKMDLFRTTYDDVRMQHDFFSPFHADGSKGLQVTMT
ncbi:hypothetical protein LTR70_010535 [Exophiala xenobiotica]|uniref:Cytochrome P450 n=1 Tax=Lithohypha guttulata TaxID=1690604 RepID=A0ABR0K0P1_9EURO|nr:hypothetical protein LTR24_008214 [Lithohypha guttulata]KAK5309181.1 hypothetical protein LTR70_010535 [Exophiala xenobiotica]